MQKKPLNHHNNENVKCVFSRPVSFNFLAALLKSLQPINDGRPAEPAPYCEPRARKKMYYKCMLHHKFPTSLLYLRGT